MTGQWQLAVRRFWHKADIGLRGVYVCFWGKSGHQDLRRLLLGLFIVASMPTNRVGGIASDSILANQSFDAQQGLPGVKICRWQIWTG